MGVGGVQKGAKDGQTSFVSSEGQLWKGMGHLGGWAPCGIVFVVVVSVKEGSDLLIA